MKCYEAVFILDEKRLDDDGTAFSREISKHVKDLGGRVKEAVSLGRKSFARAIAKRRAGTYWDFVLELDPEKVVAFQDKYRLNNAVLRLQVFKYEAAAANPPRVRDFDGPPRA